jgi:hypothetical protein
VAYGGEEAEHVSFAVSPEFAGSMPTGTVTLRDSTRILCVVRLRSARGSCGMSPAELGAGSYRLVATYNDSADFGSSAAGETLTVSRARSTTTLRLSTSSVTYGQEQLATALVRVSPEFAGLALSGTITLRDSATTLCVIRLSSDAATCRLAATRLGAGSYHLVASYSGNSDFDPSAVGGATLTIARAGSATFLRLSTAKVTLGAEQAAHLSVTVLPEFAGTPTGHVIVRDASTTLCVISLSSERGTCSLTPSELGVGTYHLVATYEGSSDFGVSVSVAERLTVVFSLSVG